MIKYNKFKLKNGLTLIVHIDKTTPIVAVNTLYDVGARDEDSEMTGFAHLFEHLMFGGSKNIPSFDEPLQRASGENNAFTTNNITNYYETLPVENIETALWLESDRMLQLDFSQKSLDVQIGVVIEEFKQRYLNQPYGDVWLLLRPLVYQKHPYMWPTIGKEIKHIEEAKLDDVKNFFNKHYVPSNAILSIAGNVDANEVKQLVEKWFGDIPKKQKPVRNIIQEPEQVEARFLEVEKNVPYNAIYKVYKTAVRNSSEYYQTDLLSDILSGGKSSRLHVELVKKQKLFSSISAYITGDTDAGMFVISGYLVDGVTYEQAEAGIEVELNKIRNFEVTEVELTKVKNKVEATMVFEEMEALNKATNLAMFELMGDCEMINQENDKYNKVTAAGIKNLASTLLQPQKCTTLYYKAKKN